MPKENYAAKQQRIGERLTRAMAKAHIDRSELAELTGYSVEQIVSWERGRARMYPIELIKLCHALDVKPEWLRAGSAASIDQQRQRFHRVRHAAALSSLSPPRITNVTASSGSGPLQHLCLIPRRAHPDIPVAPASRP